MLHNTILGKSSFTCYIILEDVWMFLQHWREFIEAGNLNISIIFHNVNYVKHNSITAGVFKTLLFLVLCSEHYQNIAQCFNYVLLSHKPTYSPFLLYLNDPQCFEYALIKYLFNFLIIIHACVQILFHYHSTSSIQFLNDAPVL